MSVASSIKRIVMPMPTPFLENGEVDERMFEELIDFYLASGVQALFINGSFGQGPAMSVEQRKRTAEIAVKRVRQRAPVMIHVGAVDPYTSSDLARHARALGADAIGIVGPYYYSDHNEYEIIEHFRMIDQAAELPVLVYNNAQYQGYNILPATMARLRQAVPRIFGAKLAKGSISEAQSYLKAAGSDMALFALANNLFPGLLVGIKGTISPPLSCCPEVGVRIINAVEKRDWETATADQVKLLEYLAETEPFFAAFGRSSQLEALRLRGFDIKRFPRWPAKPLTEEARGAIRKALERLGVPLGRAR